MSGTINTDFDLLETDIEKLRVLKRKLKKPKISAKMDLVKRSGKGAVHSHIHSFASTTIDYYKVVSLLLDNTIEYLDKAKKSLKEVDDIAASRIKREG